MRYWPACCCGTRAKPRWPASACVAGHGGADLLCGSAWLPALWFNLCNLVSWSLSGCYCRACPVHRRLRTQGVLSVFAACAAGAVVAASMAAAMAAPWFEQSLGATWRAWFSEQFSTSVLILPVLLTAPSMRAHTRARSLYGWHHCCWPHWRSALPSAALAPSPSPSPHCCGVPGPTRRFWCRCWRLPLGVR